jgi:predicted RNA-binding protein (virulence factor B family)
MPLERTRYFADDEGVLSTTKREDEILQLVIDWTDQLSSGETVSSVAYVDSGVTTSSASATTTTSTVTVTGIGETEITATLSNSRKLQRVVRFYAADGSRARDYR